MTLKVFFFLVQKISPNKISLSEFKRKWLTLVARLVMQVQQILHYIHKTKRIWIIDHFQTPVPRMWRLLQTEQRDFSETWIWEVIFVLVASRTFSGRRVSPRTSGWTAITIMTAITASTSACIRPTTTADRISSADSRPTNNNWTF